MQAKLKAGVTSTLFNSGLNGIAVDQQAGAVQLPGRSKFKDGGVGRVGET